MYQTIYTRCAIFDVATDLYFQNMEDITCMWHKKHQFPNMCVFETRLSADTARIVNYIERTNIYFHD